MHEVRNDSRDHRERGDTDAERDGQLVRLKTLALCNGGLGSLVRRIHAQLTLVRSSECAKAGQGLPEACFATASAAAAIAS